MRGNSCFMRSYSQTTHAGSDFPPPPPHKTIEIQIFAKFQRGINWLENGSWFECVEKYSHSIVGCHHSDFGSVEKAIMQSDVTNDV